MSENTTIQIKKETKQKLDLVKGTNNNSYNTIIEKLLEQSGGVIVEDTIEIAREQVAFTLNYWDDAKTVKKDITYADLMNNPVNHKFYANEDRLRIGDWVNSTATIIFKQEDDVILMVEEVSGGNGKFSSIRSIVHVNLF